MLARRLRRMGNVFAAIEDDATAEKEFCRLVSPDLAKGVSR
jgi:hypothetical protein